jgi:hypothetical protein
MEAQIKMELKRLVEIFNVYAGGMRDLLNSIAIILAAIIVRLVLQNNLSFLLPRWRNRRLFPDLRADLKPESWQSPLRAKRAGVLQLTGTQKRTIELRALTGAEDSPTTWSLRCHVREKLIEYLQRAHPQSLPHLRIEIEQDRG